MVKIQVDKKRRKNLQELHTATHILNYSTKKILGNHIWQHGSNLKEDKGTLDITHFENLSQEDIKKIENEVNKIIFQTLKMRIKTIPREEAEEKYGFTIYQGGAVPLKELRIVEVEGIDFEACGDYIYKKQNKLGFSK